MKPYTVKHYRGLAASAQRKPEPGAQERTMLTKTHTPGPWTAHDDDGTGTLPCVLAQQVTTFGNFYVAQCNVYEDARLVSAAPDLLGAAHHALATLRMLSQDMHRKPDAIGELESAIAKVAGE